jgi:hypothetical protein
MGQLSQLVGPIDSVAGPVHAPPGSILVLMKNGKPVDVVPPGRRYRGTFRIASMSVLPVRSGQFQTAKTVHDVVTEDRYTLPQVTVTVTIQVNSRRNYRGLREVISRDGPHFAEHLDTRLGREISELTRGLLGRSSHEELFGSDLSSRFRADTELLDGLFRLITVDRVEQTWDPVFVQTHDVRKERVRDLTRADAAAEVEAAEDRNLVNRASRLGLSPAEIRDPQLTGKLAEGQYAIEVEQIRANTELRRAVVENLRDLRRDPELLSVLVNELRGPRTSPSGELEAGEPTTGRAEVANERAETPELVTESGLLQILVAVGGDPDDVYGIGGMTEDGRTTVVIVTAGGRAVDATTRTALATEIGSAVGGDVRVVEHPHHRYLDRFVGSWVTAQLPGIDAADAPAEVSARLEPDGGELTIRLPSSLYRSGREALLDPASHVLQPLLTLLPVPIAISVERQ